ncbi:MAG: NUDIX hydrolase [Actinomycetia bacterium]|nr:NUDIX hydrolase [Actinomycetes bacterium]
MRKKGYKQKTAISSGGVIYRYRDGNAEIILIRHVGTREWSLPKGTVEKNEKLEDTAIREVREETGLKGKLIRKIGQVDYRFYIRRENLQVHKYVSFFLIKYKSGRVEDHDIEVEIARWFFIDEAINVLKFENDKEIVRKAKKMILNDKQ